MKLLIAACELINVYGIEETVEPLHKLVRMTRKSFPSHHLILISPSYVRWTRMVYKEHYVYVLAVLAIVSTGVGKLLPTCKCERRGPDWHLLLRLAGQMRTKWRFMAIYAHIRRTHMQDLYGCIHGIRFIFPRHLEGTTPYLSLPRLSRPAAHTCAHCAIHI